MTTPASDAPHDDRDHHDHDHHDHPHDHAHHHSHDHESGRESGLVGWLRELLIPHSHDPGDAVDAELETSQRGIRALIVSFAGLAVTAAIQAAVVGLSGSVGVLSDTLHNLADALTAVPLAIAFTLGRRSATRRFTYGLGRSEDLAGLVVVLLIAASSVLAGWQAIDRLLHPATVDYLPLVAIAGLVGFGGNELVAIYRIRVGRQIGSAALVADGVHARTDGLTSLAVVLGAAGVALGFPIADPLVGLLITVAILLVLWHAGREVFARLLDAVDPSLVEDVDAVIRSVPGVVDVGEIRLRWIGHSLRAECEIVVDEDLSLVDAHRIAEQTQHDLVHRVHRLSAAIVHADPHGDGHHELSAHHRAPVIS